MASMIDVLKHCPFCGGEAKLRRRYGRKYIYKSFYYVQCAGCGTMTSDFAEGKEAASYWNMRAEEKHEVD